MIPALKLQGPNVAIRFQPANDGTLGGVLARTHDVRTCELSPTHTSVPDCFGRPLEFEVLTPQDAERSNDRREALLRKLVIEEAAHVGLELQPGEVACRIQLFRDRFRLDSSASMQAFLAHAGITFDKLASLFRAEALVERMEQLCEASVAQELESYRAFLSACSSPVHADGDVDASVDVLLSPSPSEKALRRQVLLGILAARAVARRADAAVLAEESRAVVENLSARLGPRRGDETTSWDAFADLSEGSFAKRVEELAAVTTLAREDSSAIDEGLRLASAVRSVTTLPRGATAAS